MKRKILYCTCGSKAVLFGQCWLILGVIAMFIVGVTLIIVNAVSTFG